MLLKGFSQHHTAHYFLYVSEPKAAPVSLKLLRPRQPSLLPERPELPSCPTALRTPEGNHAGPARLASLAWLPGLRPSPPSRSSQAPSQAHRPYPEKSSTAPPAPGSYLRSHPAPKPSHRRCGAKGSPAAAEGRSQLGRGRELRAAAATTASRRRPISGGWRRCCGRCCCRGCGTQWAASAGWRWAAEEELCRSLCGHGHHGRALRGGCRQRRGSPRAFPG